MGNEIYDEIIQSVCDVCDVKSEQLFSATRVSPYPQARGLCWYLISRITSHTSGTIAAITSAYGKHYTSAGVRTAMVRMATNIQVSKTWKLRWQKLLAAFDEKREKKDDTIRIVVNVPKGARDKVNVEIKEK